MGYQGPAAAIALIPGSMAPISVPASGSICVVYTQDCATLVALGTFPGINATNCPAGQPVSTYAGVDATTCAQVAVTTAVVSAKNVRLCATSDCNAVLAYPPINWTALQSSCATSGGSATTCYLGGVGPAATLTALALNAPALGTVPSNSLCVSEKPPCSWLVALGVVNATQCPSGQYVTKYYYTTVTTCFKDMLYAHHPTLCNTSNCNQPAATLTVAPAAQTSGTIMKQLGIVIILVVAAAVWQK